MDKKELLKSIYNFYPRNIDCVRQKKDYTNSREYKNLKILISENSDSYPEKVNTFISEIKNLNLNGFEFLDNTYFGWQDRCYTFEFNKKYEFGFYSLKLHVSIILPVYVVLCYRLKNEGNREKQALIDNNNFPDTDLLYQLIELTKRHNFLSISQDLLNQTIKDISFEDISFGEFTYFNAFFINEEII